MKFLTELLAKNHSKAKFSCGNDLLDNYLHRQAGQDVKRKLTACFVSIDAKSGLIQGYYTLSNSRVPLAQVPESFRKKLTPSYTAVPTTLLGRLAIDQKYQGKGLGKLLLIDALKRSYFTGEQIGSYSVIVDPIDSAAQQFYEKYGFIQFPDSGKMFLAMTTVELVERFDLL